MREWCLNKGVWHAGAHVFQRGRVWQASSPVSLSGAREDGLWHGLDWLECSPHTPSNPQEAKQ